MNIKNLKLFNIKKLSKKCCLLSTLGVLAVSSLTGCGNQQEVSEDPNAILLQIEDNSFSIDIKEYSRTPGGLITVTLKDGSSIECSEKNIVLYRDDSKKMKEIEEDSFKIKNVSTEENMIETDTILLLHNHKIYSLEITEHSRKPSGFVEITLKDGTIINTQEENVIFYNDNSKIMDQVEEAVHVKSL